jgi:hypothetical protein
MRIHTIITTLALISLLTLPALSGATGNISPTDKYAWSETGGWNNHAPTGGGVTVYPDHLEGYAWNENIGWIKLGSHNSGGAYTYTNSTNADWGVNLNAGVLSGYAWSETSGWIKFNPTGGGVTINTSTGTFSGYAWAENIGWIHFSNSSPSYSVALLTNNLSVHLTGYGAASGTSAFGQSFSCSTISGSFLATGFSGNAGCPGTFINGDQITLHGTPATDFSGPVWTGDCSINNGDCVSSITADLIVNGSFGTTSKTLLLDPSSKAIKGYATPAAAYTGAVGTYSSVIIQSQADTYTDVFPLMSGVTVNFIGGFDSSFNINTGISTIKGPLKIKDGKLTADRLAVK